MLRMELSQALHHHQKTNPRTHSHVLHSVPLSKLFKGWPMQLRRQQQRPPPFLPCESCFNQIYPAFTSLVGFSVKKRPRVEPIPKNAFPHVIEKVCTFIITLPQTSYKSNGPLPRGSFPKPKLENFTTCELSLIMHHPAYVGFCAVSLPVAIFLSHCLIPTTIRSRV